MLIDIDDLVSEGLDPAKMAGIADRELMEADMGTELKKRPITRENYLSTIEAVVREVLSEHIGTYSGDYFGASNRAHFELGRRMDAWLRLSPDEQYAIQMSSRNLSRFREEFGDATTRYILKFHGADTLANVTAYYAMCADAESALGAALDKIDTMYNDEVSKCCVEAKHGH